MSLSVGIVGLPNVGKSTTFNAFTKAQNAEVANYPFCTIQPNRAIVAVPDARLEKLAELADVPETIHATIEFVDLAGLVRGASEGEGLGNQFLGQIRNVDAIVHVVRCFEDENVVHVSGAIDPREDVEIIETELILADLEQLERKIERIERDVKGDPDVLALLELAQDLAERLREGILVRDFPEQETELFQTFNREMRFLTGKPIIYAANVSEEALTGESAPVEAVKAIAQERDVPLVLLSAALEASLGDLSEDEKAELLALAGVTESGLDQVIRRAFEALDLISFFTHNEREARAWTLPRGSDAVTAAGTIHTDFARGFIRAEVVSFDIFARYGSWSAIRSAGELRQEGRAYVVQDGDVILFRFNV